MSNGLYYGLNPGALLRKIFPKQLNTQAMILIWTVVLIFNIIAVVLVQNHFIYPISDFSKEALQEQAYFKDCEIVSVEEIDEYYVTYLTKNGEKRVVRLEMLSRRILERARIDKDYDRIASVDGSIEVVDTSMRDAFFDGNALQKLAAIYVAIGVALLLFEFFLFSVFHRLFRE